MVPTRTHDIQPEASSSLAGSNKKKQKRHRHHQSQPGKESVTPGVSKIKSSLRQTRRLLAKDKLPADVRVETERRLKALEAELAQAELANKERTMAARYHKVKFFERQKVTRKIAQTKKQLSASETSESSKKKLMKTLNDLRVDLNYILHYPKLKKYISLFPPEVRQDDSASKVSIDDADKTAQSREEVRSWVRSCMEKGELPQEPELQKAGEPKHKPKHKDWGDGALKKASTSHRKSQPVQENEEADTIEQDDFFGEDDEDEDEDEDNS